MCMFAELLAGEDAGDDVAEFAGRSEPELQRGVPAQVPQDHPHVRRGRHRASGNNLP